MHIIKNYIVGFIFEPEFWISFCNFYRSGAEHAKFAFSIIFQKISDEKHKQNFEFLDEIWPKISTNQNRKWIWASKRYESEPKAMT